MISSLEKAYQRRESFIGDLRQSKTNCFRFFSGVGEGISGLIIDVYGDTAFFYQRLGEESYGKLDIDAAGEWVLKKLNLKSIQLKKFVEDRTKKLADTDLLPLEPIAGVKAKETYAVLENDLSFEIRPFDGFSAGLFLDQRNNRSWLGGISQGKRVLNTFAYTCAFSVYAAKAGAIVTSVDLSQKYLDWGKRNFELNALDASAHRFYAWDFFEFIKKSNRQKEKFDVVVLDPPSFSRSKAGTFSLKRDWKKLLEGALSVLEEKGTLFYSCNYFEWDTKLWQKMVAKEMESYLYKRVLVPEIPKDFQEEEHPLNIWISQLR